MVKQSKVIAMVALVFALVFVSGCGLKGPPKVPEPDATIQEEASEPDPTAQSLPE